MKKNKIIIFLLIFAGILAIGLSSFFLLKNNSSSVQENQNKDNKNVEKLDKANASFNKDFFNNVWRYETISTKIKKIDGIKKYFTSRENKEWLWFITDENIKNGIKKPSFLNKEIKYKYGDIDVNAKVSLKANSWIINRNNGRLEYTVTLKYGGLTRDVTIVYWTIEKARKWLSKVDNNYLKSISHFRDEQIGLGEYVSDFGIQYPILPTKNKRKMLFPVFHNKWLYLSAVEKAFPVVFIPNEQYESSKNSLSIKYKVSIHNYPVIEDGDTKEVSLLYSAVKKSANPKKFISFKKNRPKSSSKISLNKIFKTKGEIIKYLNDNYSARRNDWMEITNSNSEMLIMNNIELGNKFRLKFKDRDASFIDWRGVVGMNKFNNPFKGRMRDYSFAFSNLTGISFSNLKYKDFILKKPGYYSGNRWAEYFGAEFVYKSELTKK